MSKLFQHFGKLGDQCRNVETISTILACQNSLISAGNFIYYNAAKEKQWSGKLEERFKGPYYIHEELLNGSYKIKELSGKILKTPVNGELLKKYYDREDFEPMVVV
jgi:hypothetical protein